MTGFLKNTSIHGLKFLVGEIHWTEKLFWSICIIISWTLSVLLALASLNVYTYNPITFVVETTYIHWETGFPSIVVCESENSEKIEDASDYLWSPNHDFNLEEVLKEIAFFKGFSYYMLKFCASDESDPKCPKKNFTYFASVVRGKCHELIQNCSWNEEHFDCCEYFMPMQTELGVCYGINSKQSWNPKKKTYPMINDRKTGPGKLMFNVLVTVNVYILSEEEVPTLTTLGTDILYVIGQQLYRRHISVKNMENDPQARRVSPNIRRCKYPDEDPPSVYRYYSYSACTAECRKLAQLAKCSCTSFYSPNTPPEYHCDSKGLACLHEHYSEFSVLKARWSNRIGLHCDCLPSCEEQEIMFIADDRFPVEGDSGAVVEIIMDILPNERNRRKIVRGSMDLVVSIGGTVALFIGASMLSIVEIPYYIYRTMLEFLAKRLKGKTMEGPMQGFQRKTQLITLNQDARDNNIYIPRKLYDVDRNFQRINNNIVNRRYAFGRMEQNFQNNKLLLNP